MESTQIINQNHIIAHDTLRRFPNESLPVDTVKDNLLFERLSCEGCENIFLYLDWLGFAKDQNLIILPKSHHYYFEIEDLKTTETIVSLKLLNNFRKVKDFISSVSQIIPINCLFVGSFFDRSNQKDFYSGSYESQHQINEYPGIKHNHIKSRIAFLNMIYNIIDIRTNRFVTKKTVSLLLEISGMRVLDITELNGLTYFCTQKVRIPSR